MAAGTWTFTDVGRTRLLDGSFDLDTNAFKMALWTNTSPPSASSTDYTTLHNGGSGGQVAQANGYTTGGTSITVSLSGTTTVTVDSTDATWTASGGSISARYAVIYKTAATDYILCYCLLDTTPADVTVTTGNQLSVVIHASGVFTLA